MINNNIAIIRYPPRFPKSVHLYITNRCNLNCNNCYYRTKFDQKKEIPLSIIKELFKEWKQYKLSSIAIGGGEPLLHPKIVDVIQLGKELGFYMGVTTNGTYLKPIRADRVHISYDEFHPTWKNESLIKYAIQYYKKLSCKVGINHIVSNLENISYIEKTFKNVDNLLLIREKPYSIFNKWNEISFNEKYWIEGCIEGSHCEQGILSFHLNYDMQASICSNIKERIPYTNIEEIWPILRKFKCRIRDTS